MTTAAFAFFILFTWMVSSNAWIRVCRQCFDFDLCGRTDGKRSQNAFTQFTHHEKAAVCRKANLPGKRSANQVVSLEQMFTRDGATSHCKATSPNCHLVDSRVNWLQRLRESSYGDDDKGLLVKFLLKTRSLRATEIKTVTGLNESTICSSIVPIRSESDGLRVKHSNLTNMVPCQTVDYMRVSGPCCRGIHLLQSYSHAGLGSGPPESSIFFLSNNQVILATFVNTKEEDIVICLTQIPSKLCEPLSQIETPFSGSVSIKIHTDGVERLNPSAISTWSDACLAAAVLILSIYTTQVKMAPFRVRPHHGSRLATVALFTLTWNCFQPSFCVPQLSNWQEVVVRVSIAVCLSCAQRKTAQMLIVFRSSHGEMKLCCTAHQRFGMLTVTVVFIWFVYSPTF